MSEDPQRDEPETQTEAAEDEEPDTRRVGLGWIKDEKDPRDREYSARALFGARKELPPEASLEQHVDIVDQEETSSCTGQAIGGAIDVRLKKLGLFLRPSSRQAVYGFGRALGRMGADHALRDEGASPRLVMKGIKTWGVPSADAWPFNPETINDELPWDVLREASAHTVSGWWYIDSFGKERIEAICQALASGYPVVFGTDVDRDFAKMKAPGGSTDPIGAQDANRTIGGHMLYACAYRTNPAGEREILIANSWGPGWRRGGFAWCSEAFFAKASDLYVVQVA